MGKREITAGKNDAGLRLDKFLLKKYNDLPVSLMYKLIRKKDITVNRHRTEEKYIISEGDIIKIYAPDDVFAEKAARRKGDAARLRVAYEDENILIADKESGLLVHSDEGTREDTLIDRITQYLIEKGEFDPDSENSFAPALCNRIDRNTQGLVIAAKNAQALCAYSLCFDKVSGMPALGYLQGLKVTSAEPEFLRLFRGYHKG